MHYGIAFTPLVPSLVLWLAVAAIAVIAAMLLLGRARGATIRVMALVLILLALANPSFTREDREPCRPGPPSSSTKVPARVSVTAPAKPKTPGRRWSIA